MKTPWLHYHGLEEEIEGKFLLWTQEKDTEALMTLSRKRDLFRFVGVICTNQFKIGTGSHYVAFTFISFLKRKRKKKDENVPPIAI